MNKDAYYFPHFCNAKSDRKILRVRKELGLEGYGIFFMLLETLREQADLRYPLSDLDLLADEFGTSEQKVRTVITNYGLFEVDKEEQFFSPRLILYLEPYFAMKEQRRIAGIESGKKRKARSNDRSTTVQRMVNENEQSKVKESKVKESKEVNVLLTIYDGSSVPINQTTHDKLTQEYGESTILDYYQRINDYVASSGNKKYKDYASTARNWIKSDIDKGKGPRKATEQAMTFGGVSYYPKETEFERAFDKFKKGELDDETT
jgi:hypothetical protein